MDKIQDADKKSINNTYMILDIEGINFRKNKKDESNFIPMEISFIIFDIDMVYEIYSTRLNYDLTKYPEDVWIDQFMYAAKEYPNIIRTKKLLKTVNVEIGDFNFLENFKNRLNKEIEYNYKYDEGADPNEIKKNLIEKIDRYDLIPMAKGIQVEYNFLFNDFDKYTKKTIDTKKMIELNEWNIKSYDSVNKEDKMRYINIFYKKNKSKITTNNNIVSTEDLFSEKFIEKFSDLHISIYEIIIFYKLVMDYIQS